MIVRLIYSSCRSAEHGLFWSSSTDFNTRRCINQCMCVTVINTSSAETTLNHRYSGQVKC